MSNANKNKGKGFERQISKHLTDVFGLNFFRTPNSGAFVGGKNFFRNEQMTDEQKLLVDGDIIVPKELTNFSFECKFYKDIAWNKILCTGSESHLDKWIEQAQQTRKRFWILIFKLNQQGEFICILKNYLDFGFKINHFLTINKVNSYIITSMTDFFEINKELIFTLGKDINAANP